MNKKKALQEAVRIAGGSTALAKKIGCSRRWVNKMLENGEASPAMALKISKATGVDISDLAPEAYPKELFGK